MAPEIFPSSSGEITNLGDARDREQGTGFGHKYRFGSKNSLQVTLAIFVHSSGGYCHSWILVGPNNLLWWKVTHLSKSQKKETTFTSITWLGAVSRKIYIYIPIMNNRMQKLTFNHCGSNFMAWNSQATRSPVWLCFFFRGTVAWCKWFAQRGGAKHPLPRKQPVAACHGRTTNNGMALYLERV